MSAELSALLITVSDRSAAGARTDESGPVGAELLERAGWRVRTELVPDERDLIASALRAGVASGASLIVTTGGTGVGPRDVTPEATAPILERYLPGIAEELRRVGAAKLPQALLSRGLAGTAGRALLVNLPGSPDAVRDGMPVILSVARHVASQLAGGDHPGGEPAELGRPADGAGDAAGPADPRQERA